MSNKNTNDNASAATTAQPNAARVAGQNTQLKKGLRISVYANPVTKDGDVEVGVLHEANTTGTSDYYPDGIDKPARKLENWSVRFSACDPICDRWVCADDIIETNELREPTPRTAQAPRLLTVGVCAVAAGASAPHIASEGTRTARAAAMGPGSCSLGGVGGGDKILKEITCKAQPLA